MAFKLLVLFPTLVASHSPIGTNGEKFRGSSHSRKLWNLAAQENHIWGKCDDWDAKVSGCQLNSDYKCNAYNSQGPQEYDMEITLGNLTPSRPGNPVHLQWWAPRKSQTAWNPHVNLAGCAVYGWMNRAYPKYSDSDFNGGNQEVGTDGTVKIRFQAPATYFVTHWISVPHVHLRVCSNDTFAHTTQDAIVFVDKGPELVAGEGGSTMEILKVQNFSHTNSPGSGSVTDPYILGLLVWKKDKQVGMTTTPLPGGLIEEVIDEEMAKMNWDALEFSPIYQCFMEEKLFDHFTAQCTTSCGGDAEVARGQCVRRASDETVEAVATWKVEATCNEVCWSEWKNKTLHYTRLAIADMLDIPFQEVRKAAVTFHNGSPGNGRRLAERWATVQAYVNTRRLTLTEINSLLPEVFATPAEATAIMNFPVTSVQITRLANDNQWPTMALSASEITDYVDSGNDPFEGAYNEREPTGGLQTIGGIPTSGLPVGLVVGVAVALLVFGSAIGFCFYWRRRKAITQLGGGDRVVTAAGTVIRGDAASLGKKVEDNGVPATANHSPQDLARKAQDPW